MKNEYKVESGVVTMEVQGVQAIFDESDFPKVDRSGSWKLSRGCRSIRISDMRRRCARSLCTNF